MTFKQVLGIAFKTWTIDQCKINVEAYHISKEPQYKLAYSVASYVLKRKYGVKIGK